MKKPRDFIKTFQILKCGILVFGLISYKSQYDEARGAGINELYDGNKYPATIPIIPDRTIMIIGCTFFKAKISIPPKMKAEIIKEAVKNEDTDTPLGKRTVFPVEKAAAAISPTTAGFNPAIHPFMILFS